MFRVVRRLILVVLAGSLVSAQTSESRADDIIIRTEDPYAGLFKAAFQGFVDYQKARLEIESKYAVEIATGYKIRLEARDESTRKAIKRWLWARETLPQTREERNTDIRRLMKYAPLTEIWSGRALNELLEHAKQLRLRGNKPGYQKLLVPSSSSAFMEATAKINVTSGKGHIGVLRQEELFWPVIFLRPEYERQRRQLDALVKPVVQQARAKGEVTMGPVDQMARLSRELEEKLRSQALNRGERHDWTPTMYINAKRFVRDLDQAIRVLQEPNAGQYIRGNYAARGTNIEEFIDSMTEQGLRVAEATPGTHEAYKVVYDYLAAYTAEIRADKDQKDSERLDRMLRDSSKK